MCFGWGSVIVDGIFWQVEFTDSYGGITGDSLEEFRSGLSKTTDHLTGDIKGAEELIYITALQTLSLQAGKRDQDLAEIRKQHESVVQELEEKLR